MTTSALPPTSAPSTRTAAKAARPAVCENVMKLEWWNVVGLFRFPFLPINTLSTPTQLPNTSSQITAEFCPKPWTLECMSQYYASIVPWSFDTHHHCDDNVIKWLFIEAGQRLHQKTQINDSSYISFMISHDNNSRTYFNQMVLHVGFWAVCNLGWLVLVELSLCCCGDCYHLSSSGLVIVILGQSTFTALLQG